jgi:hypothetical protein
MESAGTALSAFPMRKRDRWFLKKEKGRGSFVQKYLFTCSPMYVEKACPSLHAEHNKK